MTRCISKEWIGTQVTAEDWQKWSDAFFGLSPDAFLYFLPSLLAASLDTSNLPLVAADDLVASLDTSADPDIWPEWFADRFPMLTRPELGALQDWSGIYLNRADKGEGSEFVRVQDTLTMLRLRLES